MSVKTHFVMVRPPLLLPLPSLHFFEKKHHVRTNPLRIVDAIKIPSTIEQIISS